MHTTPLYRKMVHVPGILAILNEHDAFRDGQWLDVGGSPMADAAKMTQRFRRPDFGPGNPITVDDPKAYTQSWTTKLKQVIVLNTELLDYICAENRRTSSTLRRHSLIERRQVSVCQSSWRNFSSSP